MTIDQMDLAPNAKRAAIIVQAAHPGIVWTSGRRDARAQARAMAENTLRYGVAWLGQTYKNREMVQQLEAWMATHLDHTASKALMAEGFYLTLLQQQAGQFAQFPHCRGDAWDIQCPRFGDGRIDELAVSAIRRTIEQLPIALGLQLILTREGAHRVIHAQFNHAVESVRV
jgi:hypothetical protein